MATGNSIAISPFRALTFAVALGVAFLVVLIPVLPGEASLHAGDAAYKTFETGGQVIAQRGQIVSEADVAHIREAGLLRNELTLGAAVSAAIVSVIAAGMAGLYLYLFQPRQAGSLARLLMVGLLLVLWLAAAKLFLSLVLPDNDRLYLGYILPVAAAPMLIAALLDGGLALMTAGLLAVLSAFAAFYMPDARAATVGAPLDGLQMVVAFFLAGVAGVYAVRSAERVNHYAVAGAGVALITFGVLFAFWLISPERDGIDLVWMVAASLLGGVGSAVITVGGIVILGVLFGLTTRMQLMELAQLSHPLLRELQEKAPGTFHHSVVVGNLAERAADLIGADALLVRVGCYFHDIGKVANPPYFIENQTGIENPHEKLQPLASARVVAQHITLGLDLATRHRVPASVRAFIPEHHGTRLVTYFYRKGSERDPSVDPEKFRYPGPKPQTKETGIVMLADSVEAVVRASKDRSFATIDMLVDSVIAERLTEGQLEECDLTLRDLKTITQSFKATLRGVYHPRIEYPSPADAEIQAGGAGQTPIGYLKAPADAVPAPPLDR